MHVLTVSIVRPREILQDIVCELTLEYVKPFACDECDYTCTTKGNLTNAYAISH